MFDFDNALKCGSALGVEIAQLVNNRAAAVCLAPFIEGLALYAWLEYGDDAPPAGEAALHVPPVFELKCAPEEVLSVLERAA